MSKKSFIDSVEVKSPCTEDWEKMHGSDRVRFCDHCAKDVKNLSAVTRKEAMRMVRASGGSLCIRYIKNPVTNRPVFADQLFQITRRAPSLAAGIMTASLSLSTLTYAQGGSASVATTPLIVRLDQEVESNSVKKDEVRETNTASASVSGTVVDQNGAVIPNTVITLTNNKASETRTVTSNDLGEYRFENVAPGSYVIQAEASGFSQYTTSVVVPGENETVVDVPLDVAQVEVSVDVSLDISLEAGAMGGVMVSIEYGTPLHQAVANDDIEQVRELIVHGENVNGKDENYDKITPLFIAVENGNVEIARMLLDFGAKINARDGSKQTPLMRLDDDATPELVELLLVHGAKVNLTDNEGNTALIIAAERVKPEVLHVLVDAGADVNLTNKEGQTALMNAADNDILESVRLLLVAGAKVNLKNNEGETAWDMTSEDEIEELLVSFGAEVKEDAEDSPIEPPVDN